MLKIPMRGAIDRHDRDFDSGSILIHAFASAHGLAYSLLVVRLSFATIAPGLGVKSFGISQSIQLILGR